MGSGDQRVELTQVGVHEVFDVSDISEVFAEPVYHHDDHHQQAYPEDADEDGLKGFTQELAVKGPKQKLQ